MAHPLPASDRAINSASLFARVSSFFADVTQWIAVFRYDGRTVSKYFHAASFALNLFANSGGNSRAAFSNE